MNWFAQQRLQFVAEFVAANGSINRQDIADKFKVSTRTAGLDLVAFMEKNPRLLIYDVSKKKFLLRTMP